MSSTYLQQSLCEKRLYQWFLWSVFSRIRNEYGEILRVSPYSVQMRENKNQKNTKYGHFSSSEYFQTPYTSGMKIHFQFNQENIG